jgi:hypothetical protein
MLSYSVSRLSDFDRMFLSVRAALAGQWGSLRVSSEIAWPVILRNGSAFSKRTPFLAPLHARDMAAAFVQAVRSKA